MNFTAKQCISKCNTVELRDQLGLDRPLTSSDRGTRGKRQQEDDLRPQPASQCHFQPILIGTPYQHYILDSTVIGSE